MTLARRNHIFHARPVPSARRADLNFSQGKIEGFDLLAHQRANVLFVGAGGIGSHAAPATLQKGLGRAHIVDDDVVELKNLTRQSFDRSDIGKFKAIALARRLARQALFPATLYGSPIRFQELIAAREPLPHYDVIVAGVDNNPTRRAVARFALLRRTPVIHAAVSHDGNSLYVFVQTSRPGDACWACAFPRYALDDDSYPCNLPGIVDVLQLVAGFIVFAIDTILCRRSREWNLRQVYLDGGLPDRACVVARRPGCALCTGHNLWS